MRTGIAIGGALRESTKFGRLLVAHKGHIKHFIVFVCHRHINLLLVCLVVDDGEGFASGLGFLVCSGWTFDKEFGEIIAKENANQPQRANHEFRTILFETSRLKEVLELLIRAHIE